MIKLISILCVLYVAVESNDLRVGFVQPQSRRVYDEIKEANPALWTRSDEVTVNTSDYEVISAVYVTDLREDKNGEAAVVSGGVGTKSVTISLKSPSVLRGYKFQIEVFASDPRERLYSKGGHYSSDDVQYARKF